MFSCIFSMTSSWFREPPLTPMRTGLPLSRAMPQIVANCSSRRAPVPTLPGLIRYLSSACGAVGILRQQQVAVVVEVADEGRVTPASSIRCLISGTAAAASGMLTVTRTISEPARASSMHCWPWTARPPCRCSSSTGRRRARRRRPGRCRPGPRRSCAV